MLGYSGYAELKIAVARQSEAIWQEFTPDMTEARHKSKEKDVASSLMRIHCESITETFRNLDQTAIRKTVSCLGKAHRVMICGSTRMKAGTAQKMVLNMISTTVMIKLGRVTGNFMTAMRPTNAKLKKRALFIITELTGVTPEKAEQILEMTDGDIQTAVRQLKELSTEQKEI